MIQKIMPNLTTQKMPNRKFLQKASALGLAALAGSSMSGRMITPSVTKDMVIPGGLNFQERAYYLLTGELPKSVKERLTELTDELQLKADDQVINLTMRGNHIEFINSRPHKVDGTVLDNDIPLDMETKKEVISGIAGESSTAGDLDIDTDADSETALTAFEIWKHLAGMQ